MNRQILRHYINEYKLNFDRVNQEEIYKWKAVKCYQDNWNIEAENFLKILPENAALKAKFQVVDGVGPTEAIAVVVPVSENAESTLQCLIGKDIDVKPGQSATVVITAETRKDVLLLPLSVIAGRQGKGMVTVINDGKQIQTEVMLGATDGAYIEILSGVNEGDTISSIPPNLDPRSNL